MLLLKSKPQRLKNKSCPKSLLYEKQSPTQGFVAKSYFTMAEFNHSNLTL